MFRDHRLAIAFISLWIAAVALLPAAARAQPPAAQGTTLVNATIPSLPGPPDPGVEVWFYRVSADAGRILPPSPDLGASVLVVETGAFTVEQHGAGEIIRAGGARESISASVAAPQFKILTAGDALVTGTGSATGLQNTSAQTATALIAEVFSPIEEVQTTATPIDQLPGVRIQLLSAGRGSLPAGPGTIRIERVVVDHRDATADKGSLAIEVGAVEHGTARLSAVAQVFVWPGPSHENAGPDMLFGSAPAERVLETGAGYALPNGITGLLRADGNAPATILRAIVAPVAKP